LGELIPARFGGTLKLGHLLRTGRRESQPGIALAGAMKSGTRYLALILILAGLAPAMAEGEGAAAGKEAPLRIEIVEDKSIWRWFVFSDEQR
jgi:hypothetical protein